MSLDADNRVIAELEALDEPIAKRGARLGLLNDELSDQLIDRLGLGQALTDLLSHIKGDKCPVCSRDFAEVSNASLHDHLVGVIQRLSERGGKVQGLVNERLVLQREVASTNRKREELQARRLPQSARTQMKTRAADMGQAEQELEHLTLAAEQGEQVMEKDREARFALKRGTAEHDQGSDIRRRLAALSQAISAEELRDEQTTESCFEYLDENLRRTEETLEELASRRNSARQDRRQLDEIHREIAMAEKELQRIADRLTRVNEAQTIANDRRELAKGVAREATLIRAAVVGEALDERLNTLWRELFIRLAPDESFVPAFKMPVEARGPISVQFETVHREGRRSGSPSAMLSAGNLNTAALSLFLALHLAVEPRLPCLLLDDPVQAMDEVHISQFEAVLRAFAREQHRQIVLAVHERPLFEYLSLELSPALPKERLITVVLGQPELESRDDDWSTDAECDILDWALDPVNFAA